jgi:N-acetylmuramoyl-L-alanine amidase
MKKVIIIVSITALISLGGFLTGRLMADKKSTVSKAISGKTVSEGKTNTASSSNVDSNVSPSPAGTEKPTASPEQTPAATPVPVATSTPGQTPVNSVKSTSKNKVIVIDPGHANRSNLETEQNAPGSSVMKIKDGGGTQGIVTKTPEYVVNMNISLKLRDLLQKKGYTVIMTKTDNSVSLGNIDRAKVGNDANADLVIRVHADGSDNRESKGALMMVPSASTVYTKGIYDESCRCGKIILDTLIKEVRMPSRGVKQYSDMTGFNWSKVPVIIIETGFLTNPDEDRLLSSNDYENKIANGLVDGIALAVK